MCWWIWDCACGLLSLCCCWPVFRHKNWFICTRVKLIVSMFSARGVEINAFTPDNLLSTVTTYSQKDTVFYALPHLITSISLYRSVSRETSVSERRWGLISRTRQRIYSVSFHTFILSFSLTDRLSLAPSLSLTRPWNDLVLMSVWSRVSWAFSSHQKHKQSLPPHTHTHIYAFSLSLSQIPLARL